MEQEQFITKLKDNEVFVFGSNNQGFHGSGAAATAFRYDTHLPWYKDEYMTVARNSPLGSEVRVGRWAILGVGRGFAEGLEGKSYAIATVNFDPETRKRTKVTLDDISAQIDDFIIFAKNHPEYIFLVTKFGTGLAGYSENAMNKLWAEKGELPNNIKRV